jgi:signal transduction histidine kinase
LKKVANLYQIIVEQVRRGDKLIHNVLRIISLEETTFPIKQINLLDVLNNSIDFVYRSYPTRKVKIKKEISDSKIYVEANELLLDVIENILINSVIHNQNQDILITISASKAEIDGNKFCRIEFKDNAKGISDKEKQNIFERKEELTREKKGLGLGLSLVKKIIDSYGGKIWVEDRVAGDYKKGSNFILLIPETL